MVTFYFVLVRNQEVWCDEMREFELVHDALYSYCCVSLLLFSCLSRHHIGLRFMVSLPPQSQFRPCVSPPRPQMWNHRSSVPPLPKKKGLGREEKSLVYVFILVGAIAAFNGKMR